MGDAGTREKPATLIVGEMLRAAMGCPLCGHTATIEEPRSAFIDSSCSRCGRLVARFPIRRASS